MRPTALRSSLLVLLGTLLVPGAGAGEPDGPAATARGVEVIVDGELHRRLHCRDLDDPLDLGATLPDASRGIERWSELRLTSDPPRTTLVRSPARRYPHHRLLVDCDGDGRVRLRLMPPPSAAVAAGEGSGTASTRPTAARDAAPEAAGPALVVRRLVRIELSTLARPADAPDRRTSTLLRLGEDEVVELDAARLAKLVPPPESAEPTRGHDGRIIPATEQPRNLLVADLVDAALRGRAFERVTLEGSEGGQVELTAEQLGPAERARHILRFNRRGALHYLTATGTDEEPPQRALRRLRAIRVTLTP